MITLVAHPLFKPSRASPLGRAAVAPTATRRAGDPQLSRLGARLLPHLELLYEGVRGELRPSVLHGDLWSGNIGSVRGVPSIFGERGRGQAVGRARGARRQAVCAAAAGCRAVRWACPALRVLPWEGALFLSARVGSALWQRCR